MGIFSKAWLRVRGAATDVVNSTGGAAASVFANVVSRNAAKLADRYKDHLHIATPPSERIQNAIHEGAVPGGLRKGSSALTGSVMPLAIGGVLLYMVLKKI